MEVEAKQAADLPRSAVKPAACSINTSSGERGTQIPGAQTYPHYKLDSHVGLRPPLA